MQTVFLYYNKNLVNKGFYFNIELELYEVVSIDVTNFNIIVRHSGDSTLITLTYEQLPSAFEFIKFTQQAKISRKP